MKKFILKYKFFFNSIMETEKLKLLQNDIDKLDKIHHLKILKIHKNYIFVFNSVQQDQIAFMSQPY